MRCREKQQRDAAGGGGEGPEVEMLSLVPWLDPVAAVPAVPPERVRDDGEQPRAGATVRCSSES